MTHIECEFEADVLSAVIQSRWPHRVDAALREHVRTCAICADVAAVAGAINCAQEETAACVAIPDSGRVWWKAQMRARREAVERAGRPITAVHVAAFACAVGLMGACIGATSSWFQAALKWVWSQIAAFDVTALIAGHALLAACMAAMVLLVPVALYLTTRK